MTFTVLCFSIATPHLKGTHTMFSPAQCMSLQRTKTILPTAGHLLAPAMINLSVVRKDVLKKRHESKAYYDNLAGFEHKPVGRYAYPKRPPHHHSKPWIYGEVKRQWKVLYYLYHSRHCDPKEQRPTETCSTTTTFYPPSGSSHPSHSRLNVLPNPCSKQEAVNQQGKQQTQQQPSTTAKAMPETSRREPEPKKGSYKPLTQIISG